MRTKHYAHRYANGDGTPLANCPECGVDLTRDGAVEVALSCAGRVMTALTLLDDEGRLLDTDEGAVAKGLHAGAVCATCGENLSDYETWEASP